MNPDFFPKGISLLFKTDGDPAEVYFVDRLSDREVEEMPPRSRALLKALLLESLRRIEQAEHPLRKVEA